MRVWAAALIGLGGALAAPVVAAPSRVASINACTDQLVLALLPSARITSVTWLARDPRFSAQAAAARLVPVNHGTAEEMLRDRPGVVIAGAFGGAGTKALLRQTGVPVVEIADPQTVDGIRDAVLAAGRATGAELPARTAVARMDRQLRWLAHAPRPAIRVAAWGGDGIGAPPGSLEHAMLELAGATVVAAGGSDRVEALLTARPALLVTAGGDGGGALRDLVTAHPLVRRIWRGRTIAVSPAASICGTPALVDAAVTLRRRLLALPPALRVPPAIGG